MMAIYHYECTKGHGTIHLKVVKMENFVLCIFYYQKKREELLSHEKTWRNLKCVLLNERRQSEKATYCIIPTV